VQPSPESSLSLAVFAFAICDMNVRESVTSWASSFALLMDISPFQEALQAA
jgi:hypothetical protein